MWNENKKVKEKIKKHSIFLNVNNGFEEEKSTEKKDM